MRSRARYTVRGTLYRRSERTMGRARDKQARIHPEAPRAEGRRRRITIPAAMGRRRTPRDASRKPKADYRVTKLGKPREKRRGEADATDKSRKVPCKTEENQTSAASAKPQRRGHNVTCPQKASCRKRGRWAGVKKSRAGSARVGAVDDMARGTKADAEWSARSIRSADQPASSVHTLSGLGTERGSQL